MRKYFVLGKGMIQSQTAKDTLVLFAGNIGSAFWGFLFVLFVSRSLSVSDYGIFSAAINLVVIIASITDIGISTGSVNFISTYITRGENKKADEYTKAAFLIRLVMVLGTSLIVVVFAPLISKNFLATIDPKIAIWTAVIPVFLFSNLFFPYILQAKRKFLHSTILDNSFYLVRLIFVLIFYITGALTISKAFWSFGAGFVVEVILIIFFVKGAFMYSKPPREVYNNLLKYSGWIGVNRGRLDIQMLATMAGAIATGLYSVPSSLASFILVLAGSFSSVLGPRFAGFGNKEIEKRYILKSLLAILPIVAGIIVWIIVAKPFITILFGNKYIESVPIFQALAVAQSLAFFTVPSITAIIYGMKKTIFIGSYSFFQIAAIFVLNYFLIPRFGVFGPAITLGLVNLAQVIYTWVIVIKYYWGNDIERQN